MRSFSLLLILASIGFILTAGMGVSPGTAMLILSPLMAILTASSFQWLYVKMVRNSRLLRRESSIFHFLIWAITGFLYTIFLHHFGWIQSSPLWMVWQKVMGLLYA